jgi:hypothetical protein
VSNLTQIGISNNKIPFLPSLETYLHSSQDIHAFLLDSPKSYTPYKHNPLLLVPSYCLNFTAATKTANQLKTHSKGNVFTFSKFPNKSAKLPKKIPTGFWPETIFEFFSRLGLQSGPSPRPGA